ncbi:hypothetical protein THRCLA_09009 [Thraustotheca clavata]|uniref:Uncharacterized protein n=1 Tax=Thraustotheca clavata TaxID=74557 RepID=A0A1V9Z075_9STRA|nr:hypothetical protein THRCLA_09009 [Thraustotheca clavata]
MTRKSSTLHLIIGFYSICGLVVFSAATYKLSSNLYLCISTLVSIFMQLFVFHLNCVDQLIINSTFVDEHIRSNELRTDLSCLHIQECDIPFGLNGNTSSQFPKLLEMTKLTDWNISSDYSPPSCYVLILDILN